MLIDCKGFYDYDQRETGGISEQEFDELDIGGYIHAPCPPPRERPPSSQGSINSTIAGETAQTPNKDSIAGSGMNFDD